MCSLMDCLMSVFLIGEWKGHHDDVPMAAVGHAAFSAERRKPHPPPIPIR